MWQSYYPSATLGHTCLAFICIFCGTQQLDTIFVWACFPEMCILSFFWRAIFILNPTLPSRLGISLHFFSAQHLFTIFQSMAACKQTHAAVLQLRHTIHFVHSSHLSQWRSQTGHSAGWTSVQRRIFSSIAVHMCCDPGSVCLALPCLEYNAGKKTGMFSYGTVLSKQVSPLSPLWYWSGVTSKVDNSEWSNQESFGVDLPQQCFRVMEK